MQKYAVDLHCTSGKRTKEEGWCKVKAKAGLLSNLFTTTTADVKLSDCRFALFAKPDGSWQ